ncbi:hypothetical protein TGAM01_v203786, partial [Trichoderma gamsii]
HLSTRFYQDFNITDTVQFFLQQIRVATRTPHSPSNRGQQRLCNTRLPVHRHRLNPAGELWSTSVRHASLQPKPSQELSWRD